MNKQEIQYRDYVLDHMSNVAKAHGEYGDKILELLGISSYDDELRVSVTKHDNSKLSNEEFDGYRQHFFPGPGESPEAAKENMDKAWLHHMNTNKHHPEYWVIREKQGFRSLDMNRLSIAEMVLDWIAMGYKFATKADAWFENNREYYEKIMSKTTFVLTKRVLDGVYGIK